MASEFEIAARWKKATVLAAHLYVNGIVSGQIDRIAREDWQELALRLGQNTPSYQTIEVVGQVLTIIETAVEQKIAEEKQKEQDVKTSC